MTCFMQCLEVPASERPRPVWGSCRRRAQVHLLVCTRHHRSRMSDRSWLPPDWMGLLSRHRVLVDPYNPQLRTKQKRALPVSGQPGRGSAARLCLLDGARIMALRGCQYERRKTRDYRCSCNLRPCDPCELRRLRRMQHNQFRVDSPCGSHKAPSITSAFEVRPKHSLPLYCSYDGN